MFSEVGIFVFKSIECGAFSRDSVYDVTVYSKNLYILF